jgi:hypothetical protein
MNSICRGRSFPATHWRGRRKSQRDVLRRVHADVFRIPRCTGHRNHLLAALHGRRATNTDSFAADARIVESGSRGQIPPSARGQDVLIGLTIGISTVLIAYAIPIPFMERYAPRLLPYSGAYFSLWCWRTVTAVEGALRYMFALNLMNRNLSAAMGRGSGICTCTDSADYMGPRTSIYGRPQCSPSVVGSRLRPCKVRASLHRCRHVCLRPSYLRFLLQQTHLRGTRVRDCSRWPVCLRLLCSRTTQPSQGKPCGRKGSAKASENFDSVCCMCEYPEKSRFR